jgi:hypothetical protein
MISEHKADGKHPELHSSGLRRTDDRCSHPRCKDASLTEKRRGWDSNPRDASRRLAVFKTAAFDRSATPPADHFTSACCPPSHCEQLRPVGVAYASVVAPRIRWASLALTCCLVFTFAAAGCGGSKTPSQALQREVAGRFAVALFRGDVRAARALLVRRDEGALVFLVERAAAPWRGQHASVSLPARPTGDRWAVSYEGTRTHADGRFESESGDLIVLVATSSRGAGVRFFGFTHVRTRFSTHHDSELLPSKR